MAIRKIDKSEIDLNKIYGTKNDASNGTNVKRAAERYWGDNLELEYVEGSDVAMVKQNGIGIAYININDIKNVDKSKSNMASKEFEKDITFDADDYIKSNKKDSAPFEKVDVSDRSEDYKDHSTSNPTRNNSFEKVDVTNRTENFRNEDVTRKPGTNEPTYSASAPSKSEKPRPSYYYNPENRLNDVSTRLPNELAYYSHGKCGQLARETLETLGVVKPGYKANGIDYAKNLAKHPEAAGSGFTIKGYDMNGNQSATFDKILAENNGELSNLVISFNSKGHYRNSGQYGHVITVTDIKDGKVYLMDTSDTRGGKWSKGTTPIVMDMDEFRSTYIDCGNSVNYMTHIAKIGGNYKA